MLTFNKKMAEQFKKLVDERVDALKDDMAAGHLSLEDYKKTAGRIQGLIESLSIIDEADFICERM
jgi:hypothetical protein